MKVRPTEWAGSEAAEGTSRNKETQGHTPFESVLREAARGAEAARGVKTGRIVFPGPSCPAVSFPDTDPAGTRRDTLNRAGGLLDLLAEYSSKLNDPACSLRDLHPIVLRLEDEKDRLVPALETLSDHDGSRDLLNRLLITTSVEIIKFNRGDYL